MSGDDATAPPGPTRLAQWDSNAAARPATLPSTHHRTPTTPAFGRPIITPSGQEHGDTSQSGGLALVTGVGPLHTPARRLWFGKASNKPGFRSLPHHHGEAETGAYVLSGHARVYFGESYREFVDLAAGDFMFVPPLLPHLEANMSRTDELWWLACRSPENIVINLDDVEDASLAGYRRA